MTSDQERSSESATHVWRVGLSVNERASMGLRDHLAADEVERFERLHGSEVGRRWLVSRGALREILAAELGVSPASVKLQLGEHGRPRLKPGTHPSEIDFNLSHSGELALVAVGRGRRVGIDVERLRPGRNPLRVADRYFSPEEVAAVKAVTPDEQPREFLRYWTAKEALTKGLGQGLKVGRDELELASDAHGALSPLRADGWSLIEVADLPHGYFGCLAVDDAEARIAIRDWAASS